MAADELERFMSVVEVSAGRALDREVLEDALAMYDVGRLLAVFDGSEMVGGTGSDILELTLPGSAVTRAARITHTGVLPTHRKLGLVSGLFAHQVRELRAEGLPLAVFTTSGPGIYRKVGYSPGSLAMDLAVNVVPEGLAFNRPVGGSGAYSLVQGADITPTLRPIFEAHRRVTPGQIERSAPFWRVWQRDRERYRPVGSTERFAVLWSDRGYLTYRLRHDGRSLLVEDLIAIDDEGRRALWEWCLDFSQVVSVEMVNLPLDEPALWALRDPRRPAITHLHDFLWIRVLDVAEALAARRYAVNDSIVLQVEDEICPDNAGIYTLDARTNEQSVCFPSSDEPHLRVDIADLGAAYLGGVTFMSLARAGRISARADVLVRADSMFRSSPLPWTVTAF